jgi:hypothetical protein
MCFSPEVDLVAGAAITVFAIDALRHNHAGRTTPLALLPAVFAVHTFTSAFVWWGAQGVVPQAVGDAAASFFMFIAFVFFPIYAPLSVLLLEPRGWRRDALLVLTGAGTISGIDYLLGLFDGRGDFVACSFYIDYTVDGVASISGVLYVIATCGAFLLSGQRPLFIWGIVNAAGVAVLAVTAQRGLPSLWCFLAACTSFFVAWFLRRLQASRAAGEPWPWEDRPARTVEPAR